MRIWLGGLKINHCLTQFLLLFHPSPIILARSPRLASPLQMMPDLEMRPAADVRNAPLSGIDVVIYTQGHRRF